MALLKIGEFYSRAVNTEYFRYDCCYYCSGTDDLAMRGRNTAYDNEHHNYHFLCLDCHEQDTEYYAELWREYYGNLL